MLLLLTVVLTVVHGIWTLVPHTALPQIVSRRQSLALNSTMPLVTMPYLQHRSNGPLLVWLVWVKRIDLHVVP